MSYDPAAFDAFEAAGWAEKDVAGYDMLLGRVTQRLADPLLDAVAAGPERGSSIWLPAPATSPGVPLHAERRLSASTGPRSCSTSHASTCPESSSSVATSRRFPSTTSPSTQSPGRSFSFISPTPSVAWRRLRACSCRAAPSRSRSGTCRREDAGSACSSTPSATSASRPRPPSPKDRRSSGSRTTASSTQLLTGAGLADPVMRTVEFPLAVEKRGRALERSHCRGRPHARGRARSERRRAACNPSPLRRIARRPCRGRRLRGVGVGQARLGA